MAMAADAAAVETPSPAAGADSAVSPAPVLLGTAGATNAGSLSPSPFAVSAVDPTGTWGAPLAPV